MDMDIDMDMPTGLQLWQKSGDNIQPDCLSSVPRAQNEGNTTSQQQGVGHQISYVGSHDHEGNVVSGRAGEAYCTVVPIPPSLTLVYLVRHCPTRAN